MFAGRGPSHITYGIATAPAATGGLRQQCMRGFSNDGSLLPRYDFLTAGAVRLEPIYLCRSATVIQANRLL